MGTMPCHGCEDRHIGCHGECEKYMAWAEDRQKVLNAEAEHKQMNELYYSRFQNAWRKYYKKKKKN